MTSAALPVAPPPATPRPGRATAPPRSVADAAPATPAPSRADAWAAALGRSWRMELAVLAALCVAGGALRPLWDPDLPMQLAVGEWIAQHGALPRVEPFAWTRPGAPFFALGWLAQLAFYAVMAAAGPVGLRLLGGLLLAAAGASVFALGRAARWAPPVTLAVAAANVLVAALVSGGLRTQLAVSALVPLAWALAYAVADRARDARGLRAPLALLALVAALAANTHLYFPLVMAPVAALAAAGTLAPRRAALAALAVLVGWAATPNLVVWPDVLRFMLTPYALFRAPSPIAELQPGFGALLDGVRKLQAGPSTAAPLLLLLPWVLTGEAGGSRRERVVAAAYWAAGCVLFGHAVRGLLVWWLLVLPWAGRALAALAGPGPSRPARPVVKRLALGAATACVGVQCALAAGDWQREGSLATRRLSVDAARVVDPVAAWLAAHTRPDARGRVYTTFAYGSYLTWRMPGYSASLDSRGSFPDSVVGVELWADAALPTPSLGPWRAADLAVVPMRWRAAAVLDTARGWRRVATVQAAPPVAEPSGLWVREDWWRQAGRDALPAAPAVLAGDAVGGSVSSGMVSSGVRP